MIIEINDDWRIATDKYNYILQRKRVVEKSDRSENVGTLYFEAYGYYASLDAAVSGLIEKDLRAIDSEPLSHALNRNKTLVKDVREALKPILKPEVKQK